MKFIGGDAEVSTWTQTKTRSRFNEKKSEWLWG